MHMGYAIYYCTYKRIYSHLTIINCLVKTRPWLLMGHKETKFRICECACVIVYKNYSIPYPFFFQKYLQTLHKIARSRPETNFIPYSTDPITYTALPVYRP